MHLFLLLFQTLLIGLYYRDERVYDSLLDEFIEGDQALKVRIDNVELLMFPSSELPLHSWSKLTPECRHFQDRESTSCLTSWNVNG